MSERERWIVYPLLFLALGAALRDKLVDRTTSKSIFCEELVVVDTDQPTRVLAKIGRSEPNDEMPARGFIVLDGDLRVANAAVQGQVIVEGEVNANNYRYRNIPIAPGVQPAGPGAQEAPDASEPRPPAGRDDG
jgi:hypothetical protein